MSDIPAVNQPIQQPDIKKPKGKLELLNDIRKMIEKEGHSIDESKLLELFEIMNKKEDVVCYKFESSLAEKSLQNIKVFPKKTVFIEKYNKKIELNDILFDEMIKNFNNNKLFKPFVDENHNLGIKFAEIKNLYKKEDGLYAEIELNSLGIDAIKNNKYSYISPEWGSRSDTDGVKYNNVLWAITLTNIPALEGDNRTLQDQIKLSKQEINKMNDLTLRIASLENKLSNIRLAGEVPAAGGAIDPAIIAEVMKMLQELMAKLSEAVGQKEVAEQQATEAQAELTKLTNKINEKEKDEFFSLALKNGQIEPKEIDILKLQFDKSADFIKQLVSLRPIKSDVQMTTSAKEDKNDLDPAEDALRLTRGLSVEDWKKL